MNPWLVARAGLVRHTASYAVFCLLIALATAIGVAVSAQEAALRNGSARAADRFDLLVAAPGSQTDAVLAAIYLRRGTIPLMTPQDTARVLAEPRAKFAAPLGFGDSWKGSPVVGSITAFVEHLSGGLASGRMFAAETEAVAGAAVRLPVGGRFNPAHGAHDEDDDHDHEQHAHGVEITIVGRMKPTGTPWDNAIVIPIESVWRTHQLPTGHAEGETRLGPPFAAENVPGVPAIVIAPRTINDAYGLRALWRTTSTMAFFPAEALTPLYLMSWFAFAAQALVIVAILAGVVAIVGLHRRRFAVLRALGAPGAYVFACVFLQLAIIILAGALAGLAIGAGAAWGVSQAFAARTGVALPVSIGASELTLVGALVTFGLLAAVMPAVMAWRRPPIEALSGQ
jgi:putative ABC transport system permease protein